MTGLWRRNLSEDGTHNFKLQFSPLLNKTNFNVANHVSFMHVAELELYHLDEDTLVCLVDVNCNTNKLTTDLL